MAVCAAPIHQPHDDQGQTAASHFIVHPHQQCLPRIWPGWGQALVTETIPSVAIRFQRRRIISISESSILSCAETRGRRREGERERERERRIKKKSFSSTERRMISAAAVDYRQGNYFRWNGEAKERKRIEQPPIPAHLVIQVKSKAGYGRGSRSINVFSFPFKRCPVELLLLSACFSPAASSLQFLSSPPSPLPFLFPVRSSIELQYLANNLFDGG